MRESQRVIQSDDLSRRISREKRIHARIQPPCLFDVTRELIHRRDINEVITLSDFDAFINIVSSIFYT